MYTHACTYAAAKRALDEGSFTDYNPYSCLRFVAALANDEHRGYGMLWSFDGASRGNPGAASYGVTAWWGTWSLDGFQAKDAIFTQGKRLGKAGNNLAEAAGFAAACKGALRCIIWILEQASRVARER